MGPIRHELELTAAPDEVWAVLRDVGAVHDRLAPGFVVDTRLDGGDRLVTFANGVVAREAIVTVDDDRRRLAYAVVDSPLGLRHHNASFEVVPEAGGSRLVWTTDVLPEEAVGTIAGFMAEGARAIGAALGARPSATA
jgi:Polyketide cyclase / dehydrase and lipid transport